MATDLRRSGRGASSPTGPSDNPAPSRVPCLQERLRPSTYPTILTSMAEWTFPPRRLTWDRPASGRRPHITSQVPSSPPEKAGKNPQFYCAHTREGRGLIKRPGFLNTAWRSGYADSNPSWVWVNRPDRPGSHSVSRNEASVIARPSPWRELQGQQPAGTGGKSRLLCEWEQVPKYVAIVHGGTGQQ
jgi:hypothetical protein